MKHPRAGLATVAVLLLGPAAGCDGTGTERVPLDRGMGTEEVVDALPPEIQAQLDSANAAYRAHDYEGALGHFGEVTEMAPGLAAGWYGLGMTHRVMGNAEAADSAMMRAHRLAPEIPLDHPAPSAPPNPHPRPR